MAGHHQFPESKVSTQAFFLIINQWNYLKGNILNFKGSVLTKQAQICPAIIQTQGNPQVPELVPTGRGCC